MGDDVPFDRATYTRRTVGPITCKQSLKSPSDEGGMWGMSESRDEIAERPPASLSPLFHAFYRASQNASGGLFVQSANSSENDESGHRLSAHVAAPTMRITSLQHPFTALEPGVGGSESGVGARQRPAKAATRARPDANARRPAACRGCVASLCLRFAATPATFTGGRTFFRGPSDTFFCCV